MPKKLNTILNFKRYWQIIQKINRIYLKLGLTMILNQLFTNDDIKFDPFNDIKMDEDAPNGIYVKLCQNRNLDIHFLTKNNGMALDLCMYEGRAFYATLSGQYDQVLHKLLKNSFTGCSFCYQDDINVYQKRHNPCKHYVCATCIPYAKQCPYCGVVDVF